MKKARRILLLLIALVPLLASAQLARQLPVDAAPYIAAKYAGWSGVIRAWVHAGWEPTGGSFIPWLNDCAGRFARTHEGVYIEFESVSADVLLSFEATGLRPPELVFFPPGLFLSADSFADLHAPARTVAGGDCGTVEGQVRSLPVAMGGYIWAVHRAPGEIDVGAMQLPLPADEPHTHYSAALIPLADMEAPAPADEDAGGIDLGLEAAAVGETDAFARFINGETPALLISQRELARLERLADAGRGPDWELQAAGEYAFCDQLLLCAATRGSDAQAGERLNCARAFIEFLLTDECQTRLGTIGALPVTDAPAGGSTALRTLATAMRTRTLIAPAAFAPYRQSDITALTDRLRAGKIAPAAAVQQLRDLCVGNG